MPLNIVEETGQTSKYVDRLKLIDDSTKSQIYFWVATLKDDTEICQFNEDGSENTFTDVKIHITNNNVKSLKWVSKIGSFKAYRMDISDSDELIKGTGIFRRGKITQQVKKDSQGAIIEGYQKTWSYFMGKVIDGTPKYFVINNKGTGFYTDNYNKEVGS